MKKPRKKNYLEKALEMNNAAFASILKGQADARRRQDQMCDWTIQRKSARRNGTY